MNNYPERGGLFLFSHTANITTFTIHHNNHLDMKLKVEKTVSHEEFTTLPNAAEQVRIVLDTLLVSSVKKKIDYNTHQLDTGISNITASVNVMNDAELNAVKELLNEAIKLAPDVEGQIRRALTLLDPNY
jgi:poly-gamma-glutamate capsule biosynthesis protein CapA/YwtB (metallophosphatase superfamily)